MNISKETRIIRELLKLTQAQLAEELGVSKESIIRWEGEKTDVEKRNVEKVYAFAYSKHISLNNMYEQLLREELERNDTVVLFHGAKHGIPSLPIDLNHSKQTNDLGVGFYLVESFIQAATYISGYDNGTVLGYALNTKDLKIYRLYVERDWLMATTFFRGLIKEYADNSYIGQLISKIKEADIVIAPIADNRMYEIISEFGRGEITDLQCEHALAATNLGMQYVIRSEKAVKRLKFLREFHVSNYEKKNLNRIRNEYHNENQNKVALARSEWNGKGSYIGELLK